MSLYVLSIPSIILFFVVLFNICKLKFTVIEKIILPIITYIILITVLLVLSHTFPRVNMDIVGNLVVTGCLVLIIYRKSKNKLLSGYYAVLTSVTAMIGGTITGTLLDLIFNVTTAYVRSDWMSLLIAMAPTIAIPYFLSKYIGNYMHKYYVQLGYEVKQKFVKYGFILSALTYSLTHANVFVYQIVEDRTLLYAIDMILITTIFFVALTMTATFSLAQQKQMEAELVANAQKDLELYTKRLEDAYDEIRYFRHDHLNMLYGLTGYVNEENQEGLRQYLVQNVASAKEALGALDEVMQHLKFIHIPELKGLLSVKFASAQAHGLKLELDIAKPIEDIPIERTALCRIIGIIVDNAVEELLTYDYEHKVLRFGIIIDGSDILIISANACTTSVPIEKIFTKGYSTKGLGRGLGLYNLKQICNKCDNVLVSAHVKDDMFRVVLTVRGLV